MNVSSNEPPARSNRSRGVAVPPEPSALDGPHPVRRRFGRAAVLAVAFYLGMTAVWTGIGLLLTKPLANSWVGTLDGRVATWMVAHRTHTLDGLTQIGSMLAQTLVKVVVTVVIVVVLYLVFRSWREPVLVGLAAIIEGAVFVTVTWIVARPRPDVVRLDGVSVGTSFPSGHTAAAAAYCAVVIVIFERTRAVWIRTLAVALAVAVPLIVGVSRIYRGDHYLTDVLAGLLLGLVAVLAAYLVVRRAFERHHSTNRPASAPAAAGGT
jgi:membrane-associated phospholipid phosphatase